MGGTVEVGGNWTQVMSTRSLALKVHSAARRSVRTYTTRDHIARLVIVSVQAVDGIEGPCPLTGIPPKAVCDMYCHSVPLTFTNGKDPVRDDAIIKW